MPPTRREPRPWLSASELAEYAYCPRAWWYRAHPPARGPSLDSRQSSEAGVRYHEERLTAVVERDRWAWAWVGVAVAAVALVATAFWLWGGA